MPEDLKGLLAKGHQDFWPCLRTATSEAATFEEMFYLSRLRAKALRSNAPPQPAASTTIRLALLSGYTLQPLRDLLEHVLAMEGVACEIFAGDYDNYVSEILDAGSPMYAFKPNVIVLFPSERRCGYEGKLNDPLDDIRAVASAQAEEILDLCKHAHERTGADVFLGNFIPPAYFDPGPFRTRTLASDWNFRRFVNLELGLHAPRSVHVCDLDYLAARRGLVSSKDERAWFESKQLCAPDMLVDVARELAHMTVSLRRSAKKVLVLDLDNTLWGGVIGDDGLNGIELGDTSPRGEAFKAFQQFALSLSARGVLLAVCSKNDEAVAREPFIKHPEMVLKLDHIAAFKANWEPKSENIKAIAEELSLGLDSFVFVDDNPAEIEIVRQFCPAVTTIHAGPDPARFVALVQEARLFEPVQITREDLERVQQYRVEGKRRALMASSTDMEAYLRSLEMVAYVDPLTDIDLPRATQLVNKSNQFNLTTIRRSEAEVLRLAASPHHSCFTVRLADRFGDHGLIAVVFTHEQDNELHVDTWVMSCRVLKRQVEDVVINEIVRIAQGRGCARIVGTYVPTKKNGMVRQLYPQMGFSPLTEEPERLTFSLSVLGRDERSHHIQIQRRES